MSRGLAVHLLGPPEVLIGGKPIPRMKTRKGMWALSLLAIRYGREVQREWLAGTLWPDTDESQAFTYLRQTLTDVRRALGSESYRIASPSFRTLMLDLEGADVDIATFDRNIASTDPAQLEVAVGLYRGPLMEGCFEEWVLSDREMRRQAYLAGLEKLSDASMESGDFSAAVRYLRKLTAEEPLRESAYRSLMRSLTASGESAAAGELFRELRNLLHRELNADVDAETRQLYEEIRADARKRAESTGSSLKSGGETVQAVSRSRSSLGRIPRPISEFIGREQEVADVREQLASSALVTLTGIGGVGKTRLAIQVAASAKTDFPDGAWFVDLAPLSDPTLVPSTIAKQLSISAGSGGIDARNLGELMVNHSLLLVLDNCEHLLPTAASAAAAILHAAPNVRILATSRQRLGVTGEVELRVPPLALPILDDATHLAMQSESILGSEAVRLFLDRARQVRPSTRFGGDDLLAAWRICTRLDGIPLALELAASRLSALTPIQLDDRLEERFQILVGGDRTAHPRQQTLRAMLDWSHDLLSEEERRLLRRLSVFSGGWSLEAAESVCSGPGLSSIDVLQALTSLVDHSLVTADSGERSFRYRMLETMRHYAHEKLARSGEEPAVRERHLAFALSRSEEAAQNIFGAKQKAWLDYLEADHDNLRAALDWCLVDLSRVQRGMRLAGALQRFWLTRGYLAEGRQRYDSLIRMDVQSESSTERSVALQGAGNLASRQGDYVAARRYMDEGLALVQGASDRSVEAALLTSLGNVEFFCAEYVKASDSFKKALALHRECGNAAGTAMTLHGLAGVELRTGRLDSAKKLFEEALQTSRSHGDTALEASHLTSLGLVAYEEGNYAEARGRFRQSLALQKEVGDPTQELVNLNNLGMVAQKLGDAEEALRHYCEGLSLASRLGRSSGLRTVAHILEGVAEPLLAFGSLHSAARSLCGADAIRATIGVPRTANRQLECEGLRNALQAALPADAFELARLSAERMNPEQAVEDALAAASIALELAPTNAEPPARAPQPI